MNRRRINQWIGPARQVLINCGIAQDGTIDSSFRSQLSGFGAAAVMGNLKAAAAFFSRQGNASIRRELLLSAMYCVVTGAYTEIPKPESVFTYLCDHDDLKTREAFLDASVALKLAMNLFELRKDNGNG